MLAGMAFGGLFEKSSETEKVPVVRREIPKEIKILLTCPVLQGLTELFRCLLSSLLPLGWGQGLW